MVNHYRTDVCISLSVEQDMEVETNCHRNLINAIDVASNANVRLDNLMLRLISERD